MLKIRCYSSSSYGNQRIAVGETSSHLAKEPGYPGLSLGSFRVLEPSHLCSYPKTKRARAELPMIEGRARGATELSPIRALLCFPFPANEGALLARRSSSRRCLPLSAGAFYKTYAAPTPCPSTPPPPCPRPPEGGGQAVTRCAGGERGPGSCLARVLRAR